MWMEALARGPLAVSSMYIEGTNIFLQHFLVLFLFDGVTVQGTCHQQPLTDGRKLMAIMLIKFKHVLRRNI